MTATLIIQGSSRSDGETAASVRKLVAIAPATVIDLLALDVRLYDYAHDILADDDFPLVSEAMRAASTIVFATPVYWYAMSAPMKILFDRFSDLLTVRKPEGRAMAGKSVFLLANGTDQALPEGFEVPFHRTSAYLGMHYRGAHYLHTGRDALLRRATWDALDMFALKVFEDDNDRTLLQAG